LNDLKPSDLQTTVQDLKDLVQQFVSERDWEQFHTPKNLAMALSVEAAEIMEHFQWLTVDQANDIAKSSAATQAVGEEIADVVCYALALVNVLKLDLARAMFDKMAKNRIKYPADRFQGRYK
jgi:dCTP diphosphatase